MLFVFLAMIIGSSYYGFLYFSQKATYIFIGAIILFYVHYSFLIPTLYQKKKYLYFWSLSLLLVLSISGLRYYFEESLIIANNPLNIDETGLLVFLRYLAGSIGILVYAIVFRMVADKRTKEKELYKAKALKNETDLKFLKNQLRPHFLFNSINNIYSIAVDNDDKSAPLLLEISQMLRYLIYKTDKDRIPIKDEVHFLNSLIKLYSLRYEYVPFQEISVAGSIINQNISPLILLPFIENIFKHGDFEQRDEKWLIKLSLHHGVFTFETQNPILENKQDKEGKSGIGLSNLKLRLDLLYPDAYMLDSRAFENSYYVYLELNLNGG